MARKKICGIYKITNLINEKVYIGQSVNIMRRWNEHKSVSKNKTSDRYDYPLYRAIRKYGLENFKFEIIEECLEEELDYKEIYYIELYRSYIYWEDSNGYNQTLGGDENTRGTHLSSQTKQKISKANKGRLTGGNNPSARKVICENIEFGSAKECAMYYGVNVEVMRVWLRGKNRMPQEWYDKGLRYSDKNMEDYEIQVCRPGNNLTRAIPVYCEGNKFANVRECAEFYNIKKNTMEDWLNGKNNMPQEWYDRQLHQEGKTMEDYKIQLEASRPVYCDGIKYDSVKDFVNKHELKYGTVMGWLYKRSKMPRKWYDRGLHLKGEDMSAYEYDTKRKVVICEGIKFYSVKECANYYNIRPYTMQEWLKNKDKMPQEFKDKGLKFYE